jgi:hypothetical protein
MMPNRHLEAQSGNHPHNCSMHISGSDFLCGMIPLALPDLLVFLALPTAAEHLSKRNPAGAF